jgi:hypothetical protein
MNKRAFLRLLASQLTLGFVFALAAQEKSAKEGQSWAALYRSFQEAQPAREDDLLGVWVETANIATQKFLTGRSGKEHVSFAPEGIRRRDVQGNPYDWKLTFHRSEGLLQATSDTAWEPTGDVSQVQFDSKGDLLFHKEFGGEGDYSYRCRAEDPNTLVCLLRRGAAGLEFRKLSPLSDKAR